MSSPLERLLVLAAPLFMAVPKKAKPKRGAHPKRAATTSQRAAKRPSAKTPARAAKTARAGKRGRAVPARPAAPAAPQRSAGPPLPKPPAPTGRAILLAPANDTFVDTLQPHFRWLSVGSATRYEVALSEKADFSDARVLPSAATEAIVPADRSLRTGVTYHWRVRGGNEGGWGAWSSAASFQVLPGTEDVNPPPAH